MTIDTLCLLLVHAFPDTAQHRAMTLTAAFLVCQGRQTAPVAAVNDIGMTLAASKIRVDRRIERDVVMTVHAFHRQSTRR